MRCVLLIAMLPALVLAANLPPVPNGHALFDLPPGEFQSYVSGIYEGQGMLASALKVPQIICVDPMMNRKELALPVLRGIAGLSEEELRWPVRTVVFRVLIEKLRCPGFQWKNEYRSLKQHAENLGVDLATRFDDLNRRLDALENDVTAIKVQLPGPVRIDPQFVAERLGLTPTQSRVAVALAEGKTVRDIAGATGKISTVRWHLKEINRKLNISTQAQLVRLVLLLPHVTTASDVPRVPGRRRQRRHMPD